ncbi:MAG: hypothetical protein HamCj_21390 [Candidatus Hamiltonella defensa (Ceratovacuna japonica)]
MKNAIHSEELFVIESGNLNGNRFARFPLSYILLEQRMIFLIVIADLDTVEKIFLVLINVSLFKSGGRFC